LSNWKSGVTDRSKVKPSRSCLRREGKENVVTATQQLDTYLESFTEFQKRAAGRDLPWLRELREEAWDRFSNSGFPTSHDEDWRLTNGSTIARTPFQLTWNCAVRSQELEQYRLGPAMCQLVFVNGHFVRGLSSVGKLPAGVKVNSLAQVIDSDPRAIEAHLGRYLDTRRDAFCALNTAFAEDG